MMMPLIDLETITQNLPEGFEDIILNSLHLDEVGNTIKSFSRLKILQIVKQEKGQSSRDAEIRACPLKTKHKSLAFIFPTF